MSAFWAKFGDELGNDPITILALLAALFALASTPIAFAVLGRLNGSKPGVAVSCSSLGSHRSSLP